MILVDWRIEEAVASGEIGISDFSRDCLQPASYDMRVGEEAYTTSLGRVVRLDEGGPLDVQPGDFAIVLTHETLRLPLNYIGRFGLRSCYARRGLLSTVGPQVDPGFEGRLAVGVCNFSSREVVLAPLDPFCTLELHQLDQAARRGYSGPYQHQARLSEAIIGQLPSEALPLAVMLVRQLAASLLPTVGDQLAHRPPVPPWDQPGPGRELAAFYDEKEAFERLKGELLPEHRGKYVAVHHGQVVEIGETSAEVAKQAYSRVGYVPLYIGFVEESLPIARISSPHGGGAAREVRV